MKQIGLGILNYESTNRELPLAYSPNYEGALYKGTCDKGTGFGVGYKNAPNGLKSHSVLTFILPYMEQQALFDQIDLAKDWFDLTVNSAGVKNRDVTSVDIADFLCPSTESRPLTYTTDYIPLVTVSVNHYCNEVEGGPKLTSQKRPREGLVNALTDLPNPVRQVTDGLSNTFMFFESAGRPNLYDRTRSFVGTMYDPPNNRAKPGQATGQVTVAPPATRPSCGPGQCSDYQWADERIYALWGNVFDPTVCPITTIMNCDNYAEIYSFHPGGAILLFGDGSADFIQEEINIDTFISLFTASADDVAGEL
jgi:hypothetical protein